MRTRWKVESNKAFIACWLLSLEFANSFLQHQGPCLALETGNKQELKRLKYLCIYKVAEAICPLSWH